MTYKTSSGYPLGGTPPRKKRFLEALTRAVLADDGRRLRLAAESLLNQAAQGEPWAIQELANRLDGRPAQAIYEEDQEGNRVPFRGVIELVRSDTDRLQ